MSIGQPMVTNASVADNTLTSSTPVYSIASAMIHHRPLYDVMSPPPYTLILDPLYAIGYEYGPSGSQQCDILVQYDGSPAITQYITLPSGSHNMDIVIADDLNGTIGDDFIVAVVYENGNNVYLNTYSVTNVGTVGGTVYNPSPTATVILSNVTGSNRASYPHIDLMGDENTIVNAPLCAAPCTYPFPGVVSPYPSNPFLATLHEFAITWHLDNNGSDEIWACVDDFQNSITNPAAYSLPPTEVVGGLSTESDGQFPDVAATWYRHADPATNAKKAVFIAYNTSNGQDLMLQELNQDATTLAWSIRSGFPITLSSGNNIVEYPRIDAVTIEAQQSISGTSQWAVVAAIEPNGGSHREIGIFGDPSFISTSLTLSSTDEHLKPVVAGVGFNSFTTSGNAPNPHPAGVCAAQYVTAYYSTYTNGSGSNGDMYANLITMGGMSVNANPSEINYNDLSSAFSPATQPVISLATGENTGYDLLTVWWEGSNGINWKISQGGSGVAYKSTEVSGKLAFSTKELYPNPTNGNLTIPGAKDKQYFITDAIGRTVDNGRIGENESIDVSAYPAGTYIIKMLGDEKLSSMKFVKE